MSDNSEKKPTYKPGKPGMRTGGLKGTYKRPPPMLDINGVEVTGARLARWKQDRMPWSQRPSTIRAASEMGLTVKQYGEFVTGKTVNPLNRPDDLVPSDLTIGKPQPGEDFPHGTLADWVKVHSPEDCAFFLSLSRGNSARVAWAEHAKLRRQLRKEFPDREFKLGSELGKNLLGWCEGEDSEAEKPEMPWGRKKREESRSWVLGARTGGPKVRNVGAPTAKEMEEILKEDEALRPLHRAAAKATKKRKDKKKMDRKRAREEAKKDDEGYETEGKKRVRTQD